MFYATFVADQLLHLFCLLCHQVCALHVVCMVFGIYFWEMHTHFIVWKSIYIYFFNRHIFNMELILTFIIAFYKIISLELYCLFLVCELLVLEFYKSIELQAVINRHRKLESCKGELLHPDF